MIPVEVGESLFYKGLDYLYKAKSKNGLWKDFDTLAGHSDEWVTAYTGYQLLSLQNFVDAKNLAYKAARALKYRGFWKKGWSYNIKVPPDIDSTAWVLSLLELTNSKTFCFDRGLAFIDKAILKNGKLPTFPSKGPIRLFTSLSKNISFEGWCSGHTCVTASTASLNISQNQQKLINSVVITQTKEGYWKSYWWAIPQYATWYSLEAIIDSNHPDKKKVLSLAKKWVESRCSELNKAHENQRHIFNCYRAALFLKILILLKINKNAQHLLAMCLAYHQKENGSWPSSALMRIPPPYIINPENYNRWRMNGKGGGALVRDQNSIFTSATVLSALYLYWNEDYS